MGGLGWDGRCVVARFWGAGEALWAEVRVRRVSLQGRGLRCEVWSVARAVRSGRYAVAIAPAVNAPIQ